MIKWSKMNEDFFCVWILCVLFGWSWKVFLVGDLIVGSIRVLGMGGYDLILVGFIVVGVFWWGRSV